MNRSRLSLICMLTLLLSACTPSRENAQFSTLTAYGNAIRWGEFDAAARYIAPEYLVEHPITRLELERFEHVRISRYAEKSVLPGPDEFTIYQTAEISLVNRHTGVERDIVDRQTWKYDPLAKRWRLWSSLPDISR